MKEVKPISPKEALSDHENMIHPGLIQVVNTFLKTRFSSKTDKVVISQKEILSEFRKIAPDFSTDKLFEEKHMDFEGIYRKQGWKVAYDRPAYNENYEPTYTFSAK